jgi:2-C-methyl-D-erythritol 4-phosphate cytidylyltransferase
MQANKRKPLLELDGYPLILHTVVRLSSAKGCTKIILAVHPEDLQIYNTWEKLHNICSQDVIVVSGGQSRQESVFKALSETPENPPYVLIHDAARPLIRTKTIEKIATATVKHKAAIAALPAHETIKIVGKNNWIRKTPERSELWVTHTPQGFKRQLILEAHRKALENEVQQTDDSALVEAIDRKVKVVQSNPDNLKITTPEDLEIAATILAWQRKNNLPEAKPDLLREV